MQITLRYLAGCPNWRLAEARLRTALEVSGSRDATLALEPVETHEEAVRLGLRGSPSILVGKAAPGGGFRNQAARSVSGRLCPSRCHPVVTLAGR